MHRPAFHTPGGRLGALDGVRGIAIISVMAYHATMTLGFTWAPLRVILAISNRGWLGVEIFFALSGFLITGILLDSRSRSLSAYLKRFYYRRALRIFPLYYGVIVFLLLLPKVFTVLADQEYERFVKHQWWVWAYGANAVRQYFHNQPILEFGWFEVTHFWTLAIEEHFYLLWPFMVYFLSRRALATVAIVLAVLSFVLRSDLVRMSSAFEAAVWSTPRYAGGLAIGSLGALIIRSDLNLKWVHRGCRLAIGIGLLAMLMLVADTRQLVVRADIVADLATTSVAYAMALMTTAVLIEVALTPSSRMSRALQRPVLVWFGTYSYGLYVYHCLWGPWARGHFPHISRHYAINSVIYVSAFFAAPMIVAVVSYRFFELPLLRLKDRALTPRPDPGPPSSGVAAL
jgi:peptidoglycan/LPS O-acetylase OafA/YrhL